MVLLLPPAPAALVLVGRAFATLSARSAAALRRRTVFAPPGGEEGRAVVPALDWGGGEEGGGDDCLGVSEELSIAREAKVKGWGHER